jgi:hypothetical protein
MTLVHPTNETYSLASLTLMASRINFKALQTHSIVQMNVKDFFIQDNSLSSRTIDPEKIFSNSDNQHL